MALIDAVAGAKRPSQLITWSDSAGNALDLTNATGITAVIQSVDGTSRAADGTFTVTDATNGIFRWDYGNTDIATSGDFFVQFTAAFSASPTPARSFAESWTVRRAL